MKNIVIEANSFLNQDIKGFYHTDFFGYGKKNNPDYLNILKNDNHQNWTNSQLNSAANQLCNILSVDLPQVLKSLNLKSLTVCVVPRSKADNTYSTNQLLFKTTVKKAIVKLVDFYDGTDYITRHTNTKTTHLRMEMEGFINDGDMPYEGITLDTCNFSDDIEGKDILLIDDIYTKSVNIDEDAIQALLDKGARSVFFYAVGSTVKIY